MQLRCMTSCCGCLNLRQAGIAVGIYDLVWSGLSLIFSTIALATFVYAISSGHNAKGYGDYHMFSGFIAEELSGQGRTPAQQINTQLAMATVLLMAAYVISIVFTLLFAALLVYGAALNIHTMVLPWLIWYGIFLPISILISPLAIIMAPLLGIPMLAESLFRIYCYVAVLSFYKTLKAPQLPSGPAGVGPGSPHGLTTIGAGSPNGFPTIGAGSPIGLQNQSVMAHPPVNYNRSTYDPNFHGGSTVQMC